MDQKGLIAVTGANGYIGSHVVKQLLLRGYRVRAIVRDPTNPAKVDHLKCLSGADKLLELVKGDLSEEDYTRAFQGCSAVLHVASPYRYTAEDPDRDIVQPAIRGNAPPFPLIYPYSSLTFVILCFRNQGRVECCCCE